MAEIDVIELAEVVITEFMDEAPVLRLEAHHSVHWDTSLWNKPAELAELVPNARALIVRNRTQVDAALIARAPRLKVIGRLGVGLDNIDLAACQTRGIAVLPATGANSNSVAEYVVGASLLLLRGAGFRVTEQVIAGTWPREEASRGREASGKRLGLIGFGDIGRRTASKARPLGMHILATDAYLPADDPAWRDVERTSLEELLASADVISLHVPLTKETRGLIGTAAIARMKKGAVLVNTARGGIVDVEACAAALKSGHLGAAALDVFETEPLAAADAAVFSGVPNLVLTPHIAGVTLEANARTSEVTVDNVLRTLEQAG